VRGALRTATNNVTFAVYACGQGARRGRAHASAGLEGLAKDYRVGARLAALLERLMTDPRRIVAGHLQGAAPGADRALLLRWPPRHGATRASRRDARCAVDAAPPSAPKPTHADFSCVTRSPSPNAIFRHTWASSPICNPKTATIDSDGEAWGVPYAGPRRVLDL